VARDVTEVCRADLDLGIDQWANAELLQCLTEILLGLSVAVIGSVVEVGDTKC
jgi:hypothetical protein